MGADDYLVEAWEAGELAWPDLHTWGTVMTAYLLKYRVTDDPYEIQNCKRKYYEMTEVPLTKVGTDQRHLGGSAGTSGRLPF